MSKKSVFRGGTCLVFSLLLSGVVGAQADSTVEVVQSYPIETTLQVPGIAQTAQVWLDIVNSATRTLDIEQYYINNVAGESLDPIMTAIKAAAARGVQVRFILDSDFLKNSPNEAAVVQGVANIDIRQIDFSPGIMHAKYMVADGVNAYTGSANMDWLALSHIHEMGIHTVDAGIGASLETIFNTDWPNATEIPLSSPASPAAASPVSMISHALSSAASFAAGIKNYIFTLDSGLPGIAVVASPVQSNPPDISNTLDSIIALMNAAKTSLDIQVYQYSTAPYSGSGPSWTALNSVIRAAASRGVQVRLMVDATVMPKGSKAALQLLAQLPNVQVKAVTIPQWSGGPLQYARLIHSKYFVIDGGQTGWIGSENWIDSYFNNTRNVGITVQDPAVAAQIEQVYDNVWGSPYGAAIN
jgi:phosphatidylserine/phosphatidylglycerophosphate/cardiolipin synthase-like enzyme